MEAIANSTEMIPGEGGSPAKKITLFEELNSMIKASAEVMEIIKSISDRVGTDKVDTETSKIKEPRIYDRGSISGKMNLLSDLLDGCRVLVHDLSNRI